MSLNYSEEWLKAYCRRTGKKNPLEAGGAGYVEASQIPTSLKKSKYGNRKCELDGHRFDSKHEMECYMVFREQWRAGAFAALSMQVPFMLPGGVKYIADFVILNKDGSYRVYDAKSPATRKDKTYRLKKRLMKKCLCIEIEEI